MRHLRSAKPAAARILGDGSAAEVVVEQAFREVRRSGADGLSVALGGAAVEAAALRLANDSRIAKGAVTSEPIPDHTIARTALAQMSLRKGAVRKSLSGSALGCLVSAQREALELSLLEDLKVSAIADRMQTTPTAVHRHLGDALRAVETRIPPSASMTLARWREAQRRWATLPAGHPARPARSLAVAHTWLDYQVASRAVRPDTVVLVTDTDRRFVTTSASAGLTLGRPSLVGVQIDDVTAEYARPVVPQLWSVFDQSGSMAGEYDCDRPGQAPIRIPFRGIWGRPIPDLQMGYLQPLAGTAVSPTPNG